MLTIPGPESRDCDGLSRRSCLRVDVVTTQFTDLAGRPQYLVGEHRPVPELMR